MLVFGPHHVSCFHTSQSGLVVPGGGLQFLEFTELTNIFIIGGRRFSTMVAKIKHLYCVDMTTREMYEYPRMVWCPGQH